MSSTPTTPSCATCPGRVIRWGKDRAGHQRFRCKGCGATWADIPARPLGSMRLAMEKATLCLSLLTEGSSIRSAERVTGVHRDTIMRLLRVAGRKAEALLERTIRNVPVEDVQADELWCFVGMKEKTKVRQGCADPEMGDAYAFIGLERTSKLVLAWHLGRRTSEDAHAFMVRLSAATGDGYQLSTDAFGGYAGAVEEHLGARVDYAQLVKIFGSNLSDEERRYSPPQIIGTEKRAISGNPDPARVCTSHVERHNLHVRMQLRRFTRLTNAFSRCRENLRAALALHFAAYNFTWQHSGLKGCTPAMVAGLARKPWTMRELLATP